MDKEEVKKVLKKIGGVEETNERFK